jgi:predicted transcriptional regulator
MTTFTIELDDKVAQELKQRAAGQSVAPEVWLQERLSEIIEREQQNHSDVASAADYILQKNAELYRRLA